MSTATTEEPSAPARVIERLMLKPRLKRGEVLRLEGVRPSRTHFDSVISTSTDASDAKTGRLIFRFRRCVIDPVALELARAVFSTIDTRMSPSRSRRSAAWRITARTVGGSYRGGELVLPNHRVAIDVRDGDLICRQSHIDRHGGMAASPEGHRAKRISSVTYLENKLKHTVNQTSRQET